ncbi:hypothetical protein RB200_41330 [Streptomyces sp. PmtG]
MSTHRKPIQPSPSITAANRATREAPPFDNSVDSAGSDDSTDFANAQRGLIAPPDQPVILSRTNPDRVVWDFVGYDFLDDGPQGGYPTVNPSLLRQGRLTRVAGLFHVTGSRDNGVYQVRGYDLSNMTIIKGQSGIIVIDPLACRERDRVPRTQAVPGQHRGPEPGRGRDLHAQPRRPLRRFARPVRP